jgi:hypothetical protein
VFYGMAIALGIGFFCALRHPGGTAQAETEQRSTATPVHH